MRKSGVEEEFLFRFQVAFFVEALCRAPTHGRNDLEKSLAARVWGAPESFRGNYRRRAERRKNQRYSLDHAAEDVAGNYWLAACASQLIDTRQRRRTSHLRQLFCDDLQPPSLILRRSRGEAGPPRRGQSLRRHIGAGYRFDFAQGRLHRYARRPHAGGQAARSSDLDRPRRRRGTHSRRWLRPRRGRHSGRASSCRRRRGCSRRSSCCCRRSGSRRRWGRAARWRYADVVNVLFVLVPVPIEIERGRIRHITTGII